MSKKRLWLLIAIVAIGLIGHASVVFAQDRMVPLLDYDGNEIPKGSNIPYSPKMTCSGCHFENCDPPGAYGEPNPRGFCTVGGGGRRTTDGRRTLDGTDPLIDRSDYEAYTAIATKDHGTPNSYETPYPKHGVSAAQHVQQGRNLTWGNVQRQFYGQAGFQPSVGMYGEWDIFTNSHLAHLTESDPKKFDMGSYNFAYSACGWCHPGGGALEYDRAGYRYDGRAGLHHPGGFNPNRHIHKGDYYVFDPQTRQLVSVADKWTHAQGGVAEVDCLMCHMPHGVARYAIHERNAALAELGGISPTGPSATTIKRLRDSATIGLARTGLLADIQLATAGANGLATDPLDLGTIKNANFDNWKWAGESGIVEAPRAAVNFTEQESCSNCHFPDVLNLASGPIPNPAKLAGVNHPLSYLPLGATHYQKVIFAGTSDDPDEREGVNNQDGKNDWHWIGILPRIQGLKRGTTINFQAVADALGLGPGYNPDAMLDKNLGKIKHSTERGKTRCSTCHYTLGDGQPNGRYFPPVRNAQGEVVLEGVTARLMDHKFAKGQSHPDTDDMDQYDGTISCKTCHIEKSHPDPWLNQMAPTPTHARFPAIHFNKIDCKTCHIPVLNSLFRLHTIDYSTGPYRGTLRVDASVGLGIIEEGAALKPLYIWQKRKEGMRIVPANPVVSVIWYDGNRPTIQRAAAGAAQALRAYIGDQDNDGVYDFALNRPKTGPNEGVLSLLLRETVFIARSVNEITGMANMLNSPAVANEYGFEPVNDPILQLGVNLYSISHNVMPITRDENGRPIPGPEVTYKLGGFTAPVYEQFSRRMGPLGINGCIECHSSSDPNSPNYSPKSVGFFDKKHLLYRPVEGGIEQTVADIGGSGLKKRVRFVIDKLKRQNGTDFSLDLASGVAHGDPIPHTVSQADVLGYSPDRLAKLTNPGAIPGAVVKPKAKIQVRRTGQQGGREVLITDRSTCPTGSTCSKELKVGPMTNNVCNADTVVDISSGTATHTFTLAPNVYTGMFCAQMKVTDHTTGMVATHKVPIRIVKRNERPTIANVSVTTPSSDRTPTIQFDIDDSEDTNLTVRVVWGDGTVTITEGLQKGTGLTIDKPADYPNVTKTYRVRVTVIDSRNARAMAIVNVPIVP